MNKIRALVVDDEPMARTHIVSLLDQEADVEVVGECSTGREARTAIERTRAELLFLDIQMPESDGLELARSIQSAGAPTVIFVTAYDHYALSAFEVRALDYLLKPFSADRFRATLAHAREDIARRRGLAATTGREPDAPPRSRLLIKSGGRTHFVRMSDIDWCEAAGNYVRVHVGSQEHLIRDTMSHLESELDPRQFVRVHRRTIVNIERVREMQASFNGEHVLLLRSGTRLTLSRGYRDALQRHLGKPL